MLYSQGCIINRCFHRRQFGVQMLAKEELYGKVVEVRRVNDRVMSLAIVYGQEVVRAMWAHAPQSGKLMEEKEILMKINQENGPLITRVN